jgi:hypothetical protein
VVRAPHQSPSGSDRRRAGAARPPVLEGTRSVTPGRSRANSSGAGKNKSPAHGDFHIRDEGESSGRGRGGRVAPCGGASSPRAWLRREASVRGRFAPKQKTRSCRRFWSQGRRPRFRCFPGSSAVRWLFYCFCRMSGLRAWEKQRLRREVAVAVGRLPTAYVLEAMARRAYHAGVQAFQAVASRIWSAPRARRRS